MTLDCRAAMTGLPATVAARLILVGGVRMIRNVIASEDVLHIAQEHPADKWRFENEHHKVRLQTLRDMAKAHFEDGGYRVGENGSKVLIIGEAFARIRI